MVKYGMIVDRLNRYKRLNSVALISMALMAFQLQACDRPTTVDTDLHHLPAYCDVNNNRLTLPSIPDDQLSRIHLQVNHESPKLDEKFVNGIIRSVLKVQFGVLQQTENGSITTFLQRTGFTITPQGLVIAAQHGAEQNGVLLPGSELETGQQVGLVGSGGSEWLGTVTATDLTRDLALISAINYDGLYLPPADASQLKVEDLVVIPGYPADRTGTKSSLFVGFGRYVGSAKGRVSTSDAPIFDDYTMAFATPRQYGFGISGAPVIGLDGRAYGYSVMTSTDTSGEKPQHYLFAHPIECQ